jgi:hypothetical protein
MLEFYKTPVGQSTINKLPIVMQKSLKIGQQQMGELTPKIMQAGTANKITNKLQLKK